MQAFHDHLADNGLTQVDRPSGPQWTPPRSAWTLGTEGIGWVLYVPEGTNTNAQVRSDAQAAPDLKHSDGECTWTWRGVVSDSGLRHEITVTMSAKPIDGNLAFELSLDNDSDGTVDSALFPSVRGVSVPRDRVLRAMTRDYYGAQEHPIWPTFHWNKGY
jgi:hypothetical protein